MQFIPKNVEIYGKCDNNTSWSILTYDSVINSFDENYYDEERIYILNEKQTLLFNKNPLISFNGEIWTHTHATEPELLEYNLLKVQYVREIFERDSGCQCGEGCGCDYYDYISNTRIESNGNTQHDIIRNIRPLNGLTLNEKHEIEDNDSDNCDITENINIIKNTDVTIKNNVVKNNNIQIKEVFSDEHGKRSCVIVTYHCDTLNDKKTHTFCLNENQTLLFNMYPLDTIEICDYGCNKKTTLKSIQYIHKISYSDCYLFFDDSCELFDYIYKLHSVFLNKYGSIVEH
jgi:hypothetical protein